MIRKYEMVELARALRIPIENLTEAQLLTACRAKATQLVSASEQSNGFETARAGALLIVERWVKEQSEMLPSRKQVAIGSYTAGLLEDEWLFSCLGHEVLLAGGIPYLLLGRPRSQWPADIPVPPLMDEIVELFRRYAEAREECDGSRTRFKSEPPPPPIIGEPLEAKATP